MGIKISYGTKTDDTVNLIENRTFFHYSFSSICFNQSFQDASAQVAEDLVPNVQIRSRYMHGFDTNRSKFLPKAIALFLDNSVL